MQSTAKQHFKETKSCEKDTPPLLLSTSNVSTFRRYFANVNFEGMWTIFDKMAYVHKLRQWIFLCVWEVIIKILLSPASYYCVRGASIKLRRLTQWLTHVSATTTFELQQLSELWIGKEEGDHAAKMRFWWMFSGQVFMWMFLNQIFSTVEWGVGGQ